MKNWITCLTMSVVACFTGTLGIARSVRTDTNAGNGWEQQTPALSSGWTAALQSLPPTLLISPDGTTPLAAQTGLAPSTIFTSTGVSVMPFNDSCEYDAQTYPDTLNLIGPYNNDEGGITDCTQLPTASDFCPTPSDPNTQVPIVSDSVVDYFSCNNVSAVTLNWSGIQVIYFNLGKLASLSNPNGYDVRLFDSTYNPITIVPSGNGPAQAAWELQFNCPSGTAPGGACTAGAALQFGGVLYTATSATLNAYTATVPNQSGGTVTINGPPSNPPGPLLNEFVFDGYALHAPPGWTAKNLTTITVTPSVSTLQAGQSITLTATVTTVNGNAPTPTGSVQFQSQSGTLGSANLSNGTAQLAVPLPTAGSYSITASYQGDSGDVASQSTAKTVTVTSPPPAPTVTISVSPTTITVGQSATLTWSSANTTSCTASGSWTGTQSAQGNATETPAAAGSDTYTLSCTGPGGSIAAGATLTVSSPPATVTISVSPTTITAGQNATLTWSSTNATACSAGGGWSGTEPTSGTQTVSPTASATYTLTCTGAGPSGNGSAALTVNSATSSSGSSGSSGGGSSSGGGAMALWQLIGLGLIGFGLRGRPLHRRARRGAQ